MRPYILNWIKKQGGSPTKVVLPDGIMFKNSTSTNMDWLADVDTSNITNTQQMFQYCSNITSVPLFDTSNSVNFLQMFNGCTKLVTIPPLDSSKSTTFSGMCGGCNALENFPVLNMSKCERRYGHQYIFSSTSTQLTNVSLNNILASLNTIPDTGGYNTLRYIGLAQEQATTCTTLSNWPALQEKGWTTGY